MPIRRYTAGVIALPLLLCACESLSKKGLPDSTRTMVDPATGREYLVYAPVNYDKGFDWPLVVACYGSLGDSPQAQIKLWREIADRSGIVVAAPRLMGKSDPEKLPEDQRHILSVVQQVRGAYSTSSDRILMYGQGGGALTALVTAARAADVFRAVALNNPRLRVEDLSILEGRLDPQLAILVRYQATDAAIGKHVQQSIESLRSRGANIRADVFGGHDPAIGLRRVVEFYQHVIRSEPWVQILAKPDATDAMLLTFEARSSIVLENLHWQFGAGVESTEPRPTHRYGAPGSYTVQVSGIHKKETITRSRTVKIPAEPVPLAPVGAPP